VVLYATRLMMAFLKIGICLLGKSGRWKFGCKKGTQSTRKFGGAGKYEYSLKGTEAF